MVPDDTQVDTDTARRAGRSAYQTTLDVVLTGFAVIVPLIITLYILEMAFGFVVGALQPFIAVLNYTGVMDVIRGSVLVDVLVTQLQLFPSASVFVSELTAAVSLVILIVAVGIVARNRYGEHLIEFFDTLIVAIPGIGTVYKSFRRMTDVMLESDVQNFREVKLVEYPIEGSYLLGFETNESPPAVRNAAREEGDMTTLFLPLAPNPVMGGFLAHIPNDRVYNVEMSVEEGIRTIVTSGVGVGEDVDENGSGGGAVQRFFNEPPSSNLREKYQRDD